MGSRWFYFGLFAPAFAVLLAVNVFPFVYAAYMSFHHWTLGGQKAPRFAGLFNYEELAVDGRFLNSLAVSAACVLLAVVIEMLVGLALAFLFNARLRGMAVLRGIYIIPIMLMPLITGLVWFYMLNENYGTITGFFVQIGLDRIPFLTNDRLALASVVLADVWQWTPFVMLITLAALQSLPKSVYEAARMDGMTEGQILWRVTLPLLRPALLVILVFRLVDAFKTVEYVFMMTKGGPAGATETLPWYLYVTGFQSSDLGYAGAISIVVIVLVTLISQFLVRELEQEAK